MGDILEGKFFPIKTQHLSQAEGLYPQSIEVNEILFVASLGDGRKLHAGNIREGSQAAAEFRPNHFLLQHKVPLATCPILKEMPSARINPASIMASDIGRVVNQSKSRERRCPKWMARAVPPAK